jgi:Cu(I)/Ag(I) efflux system membrane fusion protein
MYAEVIIADAEGRSVLTVPKSAVQNVGNHQVVYLAAPDDPAKFTEREIRVGRSMGNRLEVLSGVTAGESLVSQGSFFIRAEAERLGLRSSGRVDPANESGNAGSHAHSTSR